ncbi:MAG: nitroreductase family protein [Desulfatiglans sp.]|jgi:nitroreductase|nr:nitroreductase family protein [Desulfatiglans sp.]
MIKEIMTRRSIRKFTTDNVDDRVIRQIVEMGTWAPSGHNNQPWKFVVVRDRDIREKLSKKTRFSKIIESAPVLIAVFLDSSLQYDRVKDIQAVGACIQNMLLTIHHLGLGGVWMGEILKNRESVEKILAVPDTCELMAVIALGYPAQMREGSRKPVGETIIHWMDGDA